MRSKVENFAFLFVGFSTECLYDWGEFFSLAVPGMLMLLMEWGSAEVITFLSGKRF